MGRGTVVANSIGMRKCLWAAAAATLILTTHESWVDAQAEPEKKKEPEKQENAFDPRADELLKKMSDYVGKLQTMRFVADHTTEVVLKTGQKIEFGARSEVRVKRPNKLRSDRLGEVVDASFFYDGKNLTIYGPKA